VNEIVGSIQIPAHIAQSTRRANLNYNAHQNLSSGFAVLSYKGKTWSIRYRGDTEILQGSPGVGHDGRPLPVMPLATLDVVIVGISAAISKSFYNKRYAEGDADAPDCFSVNGVVPDPASPHKQNTTCAVCPQNRFGSRISDNGKKAKACADYRRLAVVPAGDEANEGYGGPMMLRIPAMSLNNLDYYCSELQRKAQVDASEVETRIGFNANVAYPEITFSAIKCITEPAAYDAVLQHLDSDLVHRMLNTEVFETQHDPSSMVDVAAQALARPAFMQQGQPQPQEQPQPAPQPVQPPPAPEPVQPPPAAAQAQPQAQPRRTPFSQRATNGATNGAAPQPAPAAAAQAGASRAAQAAAPPPAQPEPTTAGTILVQGAPADMERAIDDLLN
jgi:hypothetical protein